MTSSPCRQIEYKRLKYEYQGRTIYEWEQSLEDVHMYIQPPPGVTAKMIDCKILPSRLTLGIKGNPPFINVRGPSFVCSPSSVGRDCGGKRGATTRAGWSGSLPSPAGGVRGDCQRERELLDNGCAARSAYTPLCSQRASAACALHAFPVHAFPVPSRHALASLQRTASCTSSSRRARRG